jgi:ketosteroid isomerase-like protein
MNNAGSQTMPDGCPNSGRFLDRVEIAHGPVNILQPFFKWADQAARERGVELFFASLDELLQVNQSNSDTWRPLVPIFHPEMGGVTSQTALVLLGRNEVGDVVAAQAARFYDWSDTNLKTEGESLRMFFADTSAAAKRGDVCEILSPIADVISGRVVFSGAVWYRPDYRKQGLATIIPRISRAYAFTRWNSDFTISMMGEAIIAGGLTERSGYTNVDRGTINLNVSPLGKMHCALVWMDSKQLLDDLRSIAQPGQASSINTNEDDKSELVKNIFECIDGQNWLRLCQYLHPDIIYERPGYEPLVGLPAVIDFYRRHRIVASGRHAVERVLYDNDYVTCWGSFSGSAKNGQKLNARFADVYRLREGRISFRRTFFDSPSI